MKTRGLMMTTWLLTILFTAPGLEPARQARADGGGSSEVPTRDQIPDKYKWDLSDMYADAAAWEADFKRMDGKIERLKQHKGKLSSSPAALLAALEDISQTSVEFDNVNVFAMQTRDQDGNVTSSQDMAKRAQGLAARFSEATSWLEPEVQQIPAETLESWCKGEARLGFYRHFLDDILRKKDHTLDARGEALLAMSGQLAAAPNEAYQALRNVELPFPSIKDENGNEVELSETRHYAFRTSSDRRVRKDSYLGTMNAYRPFRNTIAAMLSGQVHANIFQARARGFDSALEASLFEDNIPVEVYRNLVRTVNANLKQLHRYAMLRERLLEVDELHVYDLYCPMVHGTDRKYTYDEAVAMCAKGLEPLGGEYLEPMNRGFNSRWIDVYETKGKRGGAYSWGTYLTNPYMLLNFNGTFHDVSTVAHEMGHSMHSWFTFANQPPVYGDYATFVAEVASTCNEIIMQEYWLGEAKTKEEKLYLLDQFLDSIRQTVFRQTMFAEFELAIHETVERGDALTAEKMGEMYMEIMQKYYGPSLVLDPETDVYALRIPHFYMDFYVYQYATSYSAAATLSKGILAGDSVALEAYLNFLKAGSSDYPIEVLKRAGVDMTTPKPIEDCMARFGLLLERFEKLLTS